MIEGKNKKKKMVLSHEVESSSIPLPEWHEVGLEIKGLYPGI